MKNKELPVLTREKMGEIAWKIILEQGLRVPPDVIMRDIGNDAQKTGLSEEELKEFAKARIDDEHGSKLGCSLSDERRNEIALILIESRFNSKADKIKPEEADKARGVLAKRIDVSYDELKAFSSQIMTDLYEKAFSKK